MNDSSRGEQRAGAASSSRGAVGAGMPRWVKISLAAVLGLLVVVVLAAVLGIGGEHGPGRHQGLSDSPATAVSIARAAGGPAA
jgi:hypothetical protein